MSLTIPRSAVGLALLGALAAGCGTAVGAYHAGAPAAAHRHHHAQPMHHAAATPAARATAPANPIPQGNGGDQDPDNNGGPSDGDGNI
jgi:disulfide bond formation protein DsbB